MIEWLLNFGTGLPGWIDFATVGIALSLIHI